MPDASDLVHAPATTRLERAGVANWRNWGPVTYRSLAVLALLLGAVGTLVGADLPGIATQLWDSAQLTLAAAVLTFLLSR
jgi:hypothetical protein